MADLVADYDWLSDDELEKLVERRSKDKTVRGLVEWGEARLELKKRKAWRKSGECLPANHPGHC